MITRKIKRIREWGGRCEGGRVVQRAVRAAKELFQIRGRR